MQILTMAVYLVVKAIATSVRVPDVFNAISKRIDRLHSWLGSPLFFAAVLARGS